MTSPSGKGRPTPKRSEARQGRGGPVAPPPQTRKEAARRARERAASSREQVRAGTARGDERYLTPRDAGPVRALVRDVIDARRNVGVVLLPLALVLVAAQISQNPRVISLALTLWVTGVLTMVADIIVTAVQVRRRVRAAFPEEPKIARHIGYGLLRGTVFRRFRLPPPRVSPKPLRSS